MKNLLFVSLQVLLIIIIVACNQINEDKTDENDNSTEIAQSNDNELVLNNGEKWQANPETIEGIHQMLQIVNNYKASGSDNTELGHVLQEEMNKIFSSCTMKGEAHNQLHNYLLPLIDKIDAIKGVEVTNLQIEELETYLHNFDQYFK